MKRYGRVGAAAVGIVLSSIFLFTGCEQVVDVDLPFDEKIVINAFIGETVPAAWISKTVPISVQADGRATTIVDADVRMEWRDSVYVLRKADSGSVSFYVFPPFDDRWRGDSLKLTVDWKGKHAESTARMPEVPKVKRVFLKSNDIGYKDVYAVLEVQAGSVVWAAGSTPFYFETPMGFYWNYIYANDVPDRSTFEVEVFVASSYNDYQSGSEIEFTVFAADRVYYKYLSERSNDHDSPFNFGGTNPYFNVVGDGIGLFIPLASRTQKLVIE